MDDAAFARLVDEHEGVVRAYLAGLGVPWDAVDEVAHEAFVELYLGDERRPAHVDALRWLKGIARNCAYAWFRRRARSARWLELSAALEPAAAERGDASPAALDALRECLRALPERARAVVDWHYREELGAEAIAERLRQTASAVRMRLMRTRDQLADCVRRRLAGEDVA